MRALNRLRASLGQNTFAFRPHCGEAGAIAGFPATVNAVLDALRPLGVKTLNGPATPETIWRLIRNHGSAS